jgi:hypothetical protein
MTLAKLRHSLSVFDVLFEVVGGRVLGELETGSYGGNWRRVEVVRQKLGTSDPLAVNVLKGLEKVGIYVSFGLIILGLSRGVH